MTLHVAFICRAFVVQVGDRLLTTRGHDGSAVPWDVSSNKTVVVWGRSGTVTISYAGAAFIDGLHTDEWLVDQILGVPNGIESVFQAPPAVPLYRYDPGPAWTAIRQGVEQRFPAQSAANQANGLEVMMTGWTWRRGAADRPRTLSWLGKWIHARQRFIDVHEGRHMRLEWSDPGRSDFSVAATGADRNADLLARARAMFQENPTVTADAAEQRLAQVIRDTAALEGGFIGTDLMAVREAPNGPVRVRYLPDPTTSPLYAYSPWLVAPFGIMKPQLYERQGLSLGQVLPDGTDLTLAVQEVDPPLPARGPYSTRNQQRRLL